MINLDEFIFNEIHEIFHKPVSILFQLTQKYSGVKKECGLVAQNAKNSLI